MRDASMFLDAIALHYYVASDQVIIEHLPDGNERYQDNSKSRKSATDFDEAAVRHHEGSPLRMNLYPGILPLWISMTLIRRWRWCR